MIIVNSLVFGYFPSLFSKMAGTVLCLLSLVVTSVVSKNIQQSEVIRQHRCHSREKILNDCNWCRCVNSAFVCDSRPCSQVDMFGHFNDAIKDIDVGMQGHGAWRSEPTPCEPNTHYRHGSLLCVCTEDGLWPNPVCRDVFRVFHAVETPENETCTPRKLYLQKCNVCICPDTGLLDSKLCTKQKCDQDDPVVKTLAAPEEKKIDEATEVYAQCSTDRKYQLDCQTCTCLRNNRLLCGNCTNTKEKERFYCHGERPPYEVFDVECNQCFCDLKGNMICSAKRCLGDVKPSTRRRLMDLDERYYELVDPPIDIQTCTMGTKYRKGCNTCVCLHHPETGKSMYACTARNCGNESLITNIKESCVLHTSYEWNCYQCDCVIANGEKWKWCDKESQCSNLKSDSTDLTTLRGYCEPLHSYSNDCNNCQCLSDGQAVLCSDMKCDRAAISVEIVPMLQHGHNCQKGTAYKIDCNICYCMLNGNSLCTTLDCNKENKD